MSAAGEEQKTKEAIRDTIATIEHATDREDLLRRLRERIAFIESATKADSAMARFGLPNTD
jgi:hypothetical protein